MKNYHSFSEFIKELNLELSKNKGARLLLFILLYRLASFGVNSKKRWVKLLLVPALVMHRFYSEIIIGAEFPAKIVAGWGLAVYHMQGTVVHKDTTIGENFSIRQGVTIGNKRLKDGTNSNCPIIGDNVEVGAGVIILGDISIGNNVTIGAGSVVTKSVAPDNIVVGQAFRLIAKD